MSGERPPRGRVLHGILRIGTFRADGVAEFSGTPQAFLNSLAPLLALPVVSGLIRLGRGQVSEALVSVLVNLVVLLALPVAAQALARAWRRESLWLRYAVAFNWCRWALVAALLAASIAGGVLVAAGLPEREAVRLVMLAFLGYGAALDWFLARAALQLSGGKAALFIIMMSLAAMALIMAPFLLSAALSGPFGGLPA